MRAAAIVAAGLTAVLMLQRPVMASSTAPRPAALGSPADFDPVALSIPAFRSFTDTDGLPQNTAAGLAFDQKGYLWVATQSGAGYYNGRRWIVVNMPNRTASNNVRAMTATFDGSMFFGTNGGGLCRLKDGVWKVWDNRSGLPANQVRALLETRAGGASTIWIGTDGGGLARLDGDRLSSVPAPLLPSGVITALRADPTAPGRIWIGTSRGLARMDGGSVVAVPEAVGDKPVTAIAATVAADHTLLLRVGTLGSGLFEIHGGQTKVLTSESGLPTNFIFSILETVALNGRRTLWIGTDRGLASQQDGAIEVFDTRSGLRNNVILALVEARTDNGPPGLWMGTLGGGVGYLQRNAWRTFPVSSGLPGSPVMSFMEGHTAAGEREVWVGSAGGGVVRVNRQGSTLFNTGTGLPNDQVRAIMETRDKDGTRSVWIGTYGGLAHLRNGQWSVITGDLPSLQVRCLLQTLGADGSPSLWVGTLGGLAHLENGKWARYDTKSGLPNNGVLSLREWSESDGSKTLWVGTYGGLARFHNGQWKSFDVRDGLPNNGVMSLLEVQEADGSRALWAGTADGGAARLTFPEGRMQAVVFSTHSSPPLPNDTVYQIVPDRAGRLYLTTDKGIARLTQQHSPGSKASDFLVETFTGDDGLPSNECNAGASMVDDKGRIWAGTVGGVALFDPQNEAIDRVAKKLYIESALVGAKGLPLEPYQELTYRENNPRFEFALLSYRRESDTRFRTQLAGLESEPSDWTADWKKEYTTLPAGHYRFRVWGRDYAGNLTGPTEIPFVVKPAPWATWWAYLIYVLIVVGIGYAIAVFRLRALRERNRELTEAVDLRTSQLQLAAKELEKRSRFIQSIFGRYVSTEIVESILESGGGLDFQGKKRKVTILTADLRGFSSFAEEAAPEQVVAVLNNFLGSMADIIMDYGGTIDEFMGDAILAIFGAPISREDDAARAAACALAMQLAMKEVNQRNEELGAPHVEMGIGVNTGEVVVGNIGSLKRAKYGIVGNPVNATYRMESATVGGQILISESTRHEVGDLLVIGSSHELRVKGLREPLIVHDLRGVGGRFGLSLPENQSHLRRLPREIPIRFSLLDGTQVQKEVIEGSLVSLSRTDAVVRSGRPVAQLTNLRIRITDETGQVTDQDLYAKRIEGQEVAGDFAVRFTSVPPAVARYFDQILLLEM